MRRSLPYVLVATIVAAFQGHLAAAVAVSEDVPVADLAAVARALGVNPPPDRARFISELTRFANFISDERREAVSGSARGGEPTSGAGGRASSLVTLVPVPLTTSIWSSAVFKRRLQPSELVAAILGDRQAALLCRGLSGLDDETLRFLVDDPDLITYIYRHASAAFAAFAGSLHIRDGRVVTPGGDAAVSLWETAVGEKTARPDRFVRDLFTRSEGRIAYLYDGISQLDRSHAAFALGLWMPGAATRAERFDAVVALTKGGYREWRIKIVPFTRPIHDIVSLLMRVRVGADGTPMPPASRAVWTRVLESDDLPPSNARWSPAATDTSVDAAWLVERLLSGEVNQRGLRLDQFSFGQRAFGQAADADPALLVTALRAFVRYRMLALTLDRIGVTNPSIYIAAARHATRLSALDRRRSFTALAQFQGALALVARLSAVRSIDRDTAEALATSLSALTLNDDGYRGALLDWFNRDVRALTGPAADLESGLIARLAGGAVVPPMHLEWEGEQYHLDLAGAEHRRLRQIREKQNGPPLDVALDMTSAVRALASESTSPEGHRRAIDVLKRAASILGAQMKAGRGLAPSSDAILREAPQTIGRVADELGRTDVSMDSKRAGRIAEPLLAVAEAVAADALLSLAYAVDLGDPDGTVLNAGNVSHRHDFGLDLVDGDARSRMAWAIPRQELAPGVPWHVSGSALGLDVALATLGLRRVDVTRVSDAPRLTSNERQTFALSVALMNPFAMNDADRDALTDAIARGRARIGDLTPQTIGPIADDIALDGWRRRALQWTLEHDPERVASLFSLTELLYLGGAPGSSALDEWGMAATVSMGCLCRRLAPPGESGMLTGRPQLGWLSTTVADVNLQVAVELRDLGLPAAIAKQVLSAAVQDYIDEVRPTDNDDWLTLVRAAQRISRDRVADYVAAVTADGPLVPDTPSDWTHP